MTNRSIWQPVLGLSLLCLSAACAAPPPVPTPTPVPPTPTTVPIPTATSVPPTPTAVPVPSATPRPAPTATALPARYPPDVIQNFMNSCTGTGGSSPICGCAIDQIQAHYTLQEFSRIEVQLAGGQQLPQAIVNILADCRISVR